MGTLWAQLLLQFSTDCFETLQMLSAWNEDVHVVLVKYFDYFFSLFLLCELSLFFLHEILSVFFFFFFYMKFFFLHEMLSKCIDSGYLVGTTPLTVLR